MTSAQAKMLIETDPDFIYSKRFGYSLAELEKRYPEGAPTRIIAAVFMISEDEVRIRYQQVIGKLRRHIGV